MNIKKELEENQTVLLLFEGKDYNELAISIAKDLSEKNVCFVTLNKTFYSLKEIFEKNGVNMQNVIFIDGITNTIRKTDSQEKGCYFVSSPNSLTELSIAINKFLKHGFDYLVFDSISNLLIYHKKEVLAKFLSSIINNIRLNKTKSVFFALNLTETKALIQETSIFVDKIIDVSEKGFENKVNELSKRRNK
ncbi:MAG: hypothetical protein JW703_00115 [Candidatus Diapherotrites archaeon]|nr:hypothetical protein [Candidatus Diapherotrites archaeon]